MLFRRSDRSNAPATRASDAAAEGRAAHGGRTVIGEQTRFKGTIKGQGAVVISGMLTGGIDIAGPLTVASTGRVEGDVDVQTAQLSGQARGRIRASGRVRLDPTAVFEGEIATPVLDLRPGSILRGRASILGHLLRPPIR